MNLAKVPLSNPSRLYQRVMPLSRPPFGSQTPHAPHVQHRYVKGTEVGTTYSTVRLEATQRTYVVGTVPTIVADANRLAPQPLLGSLSQQMLSISLALCPRLKPPTWPSKCLVGLTPRISPFSAPMDESPLLDAAFRVAPKTETTRLDLRRWW